MLPSELANKSLQTWTLDDLKLIIERQSEESQFLEFKERMPISRSALGWNFGGQLHANERDGLAKEIVAFANAYGGHVVVGIKETTEKPSRAESFGELNNDVMELAERLRSALNSIVDPPINGLQIHPISVEENGGGYIVIQIPKSIYAPHGYGNPPLSYVRRGASSFPMTMRDIQSVFWETRTRKERVENELAKFYEQFSDYKFEANRLAFGFVAVSKESIELKNIWDYLISKFNIRKTGEFPDCLFETGEVESSVCAPTNVRKWFPNSRGANYRYFDTSVTDGNVQEGMWSVDDGGLVSFVGNKEGYKPGENRIFGDNRSDPQIRFDQSEIVGALKQFLDLVRLVSYAGLNYPRNWIVQGFFKTNIAPVFCNSHTHDWARVDFKHGVSFRPIEIDLQQLDYWPEYLVRRVWESFETAVSTDQLQYLSEILTEHWGKWDFA